MASVLDTKASHGVRDSEYDCAESLSSVFPFTEEEENFSTVSLKSTNPRT